MPGTDHPNNQASGVCPDRASDSTVIRYAAPAGEGALPLSSDYRIFVNGLPVDVYRVKVLRPHTWGGDVGPQAHESAAMAYFDFDGPVHVRVEVDTPIDHARIRPLRYEIEPVVKGSGLEFTLTRPCKLSIEINEDITHNLQLFTNPLEQDVPDRDDPNVRYFGPGVHHPHDGGVPGAIQLHSNTTIYIAGGAIVHGSIETPFHEAVHDITVRGRGILLGENDTRCKRGLMKLGFNARRINIRDIHLIDSYGWNVEIDWCRDVEISNLKILGYRGNSDGIDICSSNDVVVRDCYIRSADDNLVVVNVQYDEQLRNFFIHADGGYDHHYGLLFKHLHYQGQKRNASHIRFSDCVIWQDRDGPSPIHVGWSMRSQRLSDVQFKDIDILHTRGGDKTAQIDIDTSWWGEPGNVVENISFDHINIEDAHGGHLIQVRQINEPAQIRHVRFRGVRLLGGQFSESLIDASAKESRIQDVTIEGMTVFDQPIDSPQQGKFRIHADCVGCAVVS
jgi:hypothetical protein